MSVQVHPGNTADPSTVPDALDTIKQKFGIERVILVGDRAMITDAHATTLKELGAGFVSALKTPQIRKLTRVICSCRCSTSATWPRSQVASSRASG